MSNDTIGGYTFCDRHAPLFRCGLHKHDAGSSATFADIFFRGANATATPRGEISPDTFTLEAFTRCRIFRFYFFPVAFKFFRNHLGQARNGALPHF